MLSNNIYKTTPSSRMLIGVSSIFLIAFASYNWIVSPQTTCLKAAQQQYNMLKNSGQKAIVMRSQVRKKENMISDIKGDLELKKKFFFTPDEAREFFFSVEKILEKSGCAIQALNFVNHQSVKTPSEEASGLVVPKTAKLRFTGSYQTIIDFIMQIQDLPQKVVIEDMLTTADKLNKGQLECGMTITIYTIQDRKVPSDD